VTRWRELVAAALVGTDRRPLADTTGSAGATEPATTDPATTVLDRAAAWSVYRRAGAPPVHDIAAPRPAPDEPNPVAGPAAAARLAGLLEAVWEGGARMALVAEWLTVAHERGRRVPPEWLPDLLDAARRYEVLRPLVVAAGGARVAWLAAQSPEWTFVTGTHDPSAGHSLPPHDLAAWREGTLGQRAAYLTGLRADGPDEGRALLGEEWSTLGPEERAHLLAVLRTGLGPADEEFLEAALDDKRREVREVAADLLAAVPGSAYNRRMADRARACLRPGEGTLTVQPPIECDAAMRRDGIVARPPSGIGARAWWLEQVLARAPLDAIEYLTAELVRGASTVDDWTWTTYRGLARAAAARGDHAWAAVLIDLLQGRPDARDRQLVEALHGALAPEEIVRRAIAVCATEPGPEPLRRLETLLAHVAAPWPDDLSTAVVRWVDTAARGPVANRVSGVCGLAAMSMAPKFADLVARTAERLRSEAPTMPSAGYALDRMVTTLAFRHDMIEELR
jgi:Family of unknown function (DUF5691)